MRPGMRLRRRTRKDCEVNKCAPNGHRIISLENESTFRSFVPSLCIVQRGFHLDSYTATPRLWYLRIFAFCSPLKLYGKAFSI